MKVAWIIKADKIKVVEQVADVSESEGNVPQTPQKRPEDEALERSLRSSFDSFGFDKVFMSGGSSDDWDLDVNDLHMMHARIE